MRAFVAVELPADVRARIGAFQDQLAACGADVKWTEPPNLHVTVRFLGEIDAAQQSAIEALLRRVTAPRAPIEVLLSELGAFPSVRRPRVVWLGISRGREALAEVAAELERGLGACGIAPEDRPFAAHVTLGRVRSSRGLGRLVERLGLGGWVPPPPFAADHLTFFQSCLSSAGPTYTLILRAPLAASA